MISRFLLLPLVLFSITAMSQPYFPLPTDSTSWKVAGYTSGPPGSHYKQFEYQYETAGDTLIDTTFYIKIINSVSKQYLGSFREDSTRKVYYLDRDSIREALLFDFAVDSGDSVIGIYNTFNDTLIVKRIDTLPLSSQPFPGMNRRIIYLTNTNNNDLVTSTWIEGIGSEAGLLDCSYIPIHEVLRSLECFRYKGQPYIFKFNCNPVGIELQPDRNFSIAFPNPFNGSQTITFVNPPAKKLTLSIVNLSGQLIYSNFISADKGFVLDAQQFSPGTYILAIEAFGTRILSEKIIFQ